MPLDAPNLDDLRFQRLVDEAKRRIPRYCPEWTDYNVSDPGVTLIELFAYMTEQLGYRLNRVPEKMYIKFLELLGIRLLPPVAARVPLTFWLSAPLPLHEEDQTIVTIPRDTAVGTRPQADEREIVFSTETDLVLKKPELCEFYLGDLTTIDHSTNYHSQIVKENASVLENLHKHGIPLLVFGAGTNPTGVFHLGFKRESAINGYILRLDFACVKGAATGVVSERPPWKWEYAALDENKKLRWHSVPHLGVHPSEKCEKSGLNEAREFVVLYLPPDMHPIGLSDGADPRYYVRCRPIRTGDPKNYYKDSPKVLGVTASCLGGAVWAVQMEVARNEVLGYASGDPGQTFRLEHTPLLGDRGIEMVEVAEERDDNFVPWQIVEDISISNRYDRHVTLDPCSREVAFGPNIRQQDGSMRQYGRVPEAGRPVRISQYRYGGGIAGNVPAGKVETLHSAIPYVDRVTNLQEAVGGRDQETLEEAKMRAHRMIRGQQRAVTSGDFEALALAAGEDKVARARCFRRDGNQVQVLIVPRGFDPLRNPDLSRLRLPEELKKLIEQYLTDRRWLTTSSVQVMAPTYIAVEIVAEIEASDDKQRPDIEARASDMLACLVTPVSPGRTILDPWRERTVEALRLIETLPGFGEHTGRTGDIAGAEWQGWPFGRELRSTEISALLRNIPGIKQVHRVRIYYSTLEGQSRIARDAGAGPPAPGAPSPLTEAAAGVLEMQPYQLLCSLRHKVSFVAPSTNREASR